MLNILRSRADAPNPDFVEAAREPREDNVAWVRRNLPTGGEGVYLLLVGGRDRLSFRLRVAQSQVRDDLSPSQWSHVALFHELADEPGDTPLVEISLDPRGGFGFPAPSNGVQEGRLATYRARRAWPNIAVARIPAPATDVRDAVAGFRGQRAVLDATELIVVWLAYLWGAGRAANPLLDSHGIPSAAMLEVVVGAAGYDLTPGLESRASCPEAIWQAARWWHPYYGGKAAAAPAGAWTAEHRLGER